MYRKSLVLIAAAAAAQVMPLPAHAQPAPEEITVEGRYGRVPDSVQTLSQVVSYSDLDLSTKVGRDELRHRIRLTARFLCDKLGETDSARSALPSCQSAAISDAESRVGKVEAGFAPRGTAWVAPPAWKAPYPDEWAKQYP